MFFPVEADEDRTEERLLGKDYGEKIDAKQQ